MPIGMSKNGWFNTIPSLNNRAMQLYYDKYTSKLWVLDQFCLQDTGAHRIFNNVAIWDGVEWAPFTRYPNENGHAGSGVGDVVTSILQIQNDWGLTFPTS